MRRLGIALVVVYVLAWTATIRADTPTYRMSKAQPEKYAPAGHTR